jgi:hypothetical protein
MTGAEQKELHELSYELGRNAKGLEDLNKLFEQHCKDDDRRHEENVALLKANNDAIAAQNKAFEKLAAQIALSPSGSVLSRKQLAVLAVVGTGAMVVVGWMVEAAVKWAVGWLIGSILKVKLGG